MDFQGFRTEAFAWFEELAANNNRAWFLAHEEEYEEHVLTPARQLVRELAPFLEKLNPALRPSEKPDRHFSRIALGSQASEETPAYKTNLHIFFWNRELKRLSDGALFLTVSAEGIGLGFSIYDFGHGRQARMETVFKPRLRQHLEKLDAYIKAAYLRRGFQFHRFVRAPGRLGLREVDPFPDRASEWENTLGWVASRYIHTESSRLTPGSFVTEVQETFARLYPLYNFACDPRTDWKRRMKA